MFLLSQWRVDLKPKSGALTADSKTPMYTLLIQRIIRPLIDDTKSEFTHLRLHNKRPTGTFITRFSVKPKLLFTSTAITTKTINSQNIYYV